MKNSFKSIKNNNRKVISKIVFITIILIIFSTIFLLLKFINGLDTSLIKISSNELKRVSYSFITERLNNTIFNNETLNNILILEKNDYNEIVYVDFNLNQAYKVLDNVSNILNDSFNELSGGNITINYLDKDLSHDLGSMVLTIPIGNSFNNLYFYNFGPRVPVKINFIGSVLTNLKTKVTNYGINNALVELFVYIKYDIEIISPFKTDKISIDYDAVIASMMIEGKVPSFYGSSIERQSNLYTKEIE